MTSNFDPNLDKRHLATQENRQVVTAYFKSNTSKGKDTMLPLFFVKDTAGAVTCEQGLCLGKKIARRGKGKGERCLFAFSSPQFPARLKACSQTTGDVIWLDVFQPLCGLNSKLGQKAHRSLRISKNFLQLPFFQEDFLAQFQADLTEGWLMYLLKTLRLTSTILDKIRWNINPFSILQNKRWGNGAVCLSRGFFASDFGPTGTFFPS